MTTPHDARHPGEFIKANVIPRGMPVKKAAELLGVGRPALSNLLNAKAGLSAEMALRLAKTFGANQEALLQKQADYDNQQNRHREKSVAVRAYAPSFMDITATQITAWADKHDARAEIAVLLRKLILSTGTNVSKIDFPAHDNAERHGWDGQLETDTATPWIPVGSSGWEFGCNQDPKAKAEKDYKARVAGLPSAERKNMTFVFVTPRNWPGKNGWVKEKVDEKHWKDVKALDASDLEQWLEQSVPAQSWISERLGNGSDDTLSLEECWDRWAKVTKPELSKRLFAGSMDSHKEGLTNWLKNAPQKPFVITSDSEEETLAYLACALDMPDGDYADRAIVLRSPSGLRRATKSSSNFIAVLVSPEVEAASAGLHKTQHTIIVRRRNAVEGDPDIELDLADDNTFKTGLIDMGVPEDDVRALSLASGQSLTILRRRLSDVPAIKFPPWAKDSALTRNLIPLGFAGAWDSQSKEDQEILSYLTGDRYQAIEKSVTDLLRLEHSPVWSVGHYRGVTSKIDVLYAIKGLVTKEDLDNFFLTARIVLSERDPALDLSEDKRYAAGLYGKTRNHSAALRDGMCETLVLLAIHGNNLFRERLGMDVEGHVNNTVRELLMPFAAETWASQRGDLPRYAEAAPDLFLEIVEQDLKSDDPKILSLLKPASSQMFGGGCPRSGLLWALELLAWKPQRLATVTNILARMSEVRIDDNWVNKPENSLEAIFRAWIPQTAATVEQRCAVLENLTRRFPEIGWRLCVEQIDLSHSVGHYSHRPRWRNDASGAGQPVTEGEIRKFVLRALELAIEWPSHSEKTFGDLIQHIQSISDADQERVWNKIRAWIASDPGDEKKANLRERIRLYSFTRRARNRGVAVKASDSAREIYEALKAADPFVRHQWLFARQWVEESFDEIDAGSFDYRKREEKIAKQRTEAIAEVWKVHAYDGILRLCESGEAANVVGWLMADMTLKGFDAEDFLFRLGSESATRSPAAVNNLISGYLLRLDDSVRVRLLSALILRFQAEGDADEANIVRVLRAAPFKWSTWSVVDAMPEPLRQRYWIEANPYNWHSDEGEELCEAIDRLLLINRPKAALAFVRLYIEKVDSPRIMRLLKAVATTSSNVDVNVRFHSYEFVKAFETLDDRADVPMDELAHLEFLYLSALEHEKRGIPNLERQLVTSPVLFVQAVGLVYIRRDGGEDPPEWYVENEEARKNVATQAYRLLHKAKRIPGTGDDGTIDSLKLKAWIEDVRAQCKAYGREDVGDSCIGELLSKSIRDKDGIWPAVAVREALEEIGNQSIANAMAIGLYNQRGAHWRDVDGRQERDLATQYRSWAKQTAVEWPFTSRLLEQIAKSYDYDAEWHDTNATLRKRLPY
jgi:addiction module HigA family antidote